MLVELLILILIFALVLYVFRSLVPIDPFLYKIAVIVCCVILIIWLIDAAGLVGGQSRLRLLR